MENSENNENTIKKIDLEKIVEARKKEIRKLNECEIESKNLIKSEEVAKTIVKHAYCENCNEELISSAPPMFNPFTLERICRHVCSKCGIEYNLEYAYPRLVFLNSKNEEIKAYTI